MPKPPVNLALLCDPVGAQFCETLDNFSMFDLDCTPCGISYRSGSVIDLSQIEITFSEDPVGNLETGVSIEIDSVQTTIIDAVAVGAVVTYTVSESIDDGDSVKWIYDADVGDIVGENGTELRGGTYNVVNPLDTKAPTMQAAEVGNVGDNTVVMTFNEPIQSTDFAVGWSVTADAVPLTMSGNSLYLNGVLYITTIEYVLEGQVVTVSYDAGVGDITDVSGFPSLNALASITDAPVTNNVVEGPDTERPQITAFQANGGSGISTSRIISIDILDATDNVSTAPDMEYQVNTTPASPPSPGDPNWVSFANRLNPITVPSDGTFTLTAYAKDEADNVSLGIGLSQQVVEVDTIAPTVLNANVDAAGVLLTINMSENVTGNAGFSLTADGSGVALSAPGGSGSQITFTCAQIYQGQVLLLSYMAGDVVDGFGHPLANFSDQSVTNNSTVDVPPVSLEFEAFAPADADNEMLGVKVGAGGLTEERVSSVWVEDFQGIRQEFGTNEPAWAGGRVTGAVGSRVVYGDNPPGTPLPEIPMIVHAPEATNFFLDSDAPATQIISGLVAVPHTCWIEGAGSATLSGGATGTVTEGNPVTFTPSGDVTVTIAATVDICQLENTSKPSPYIATTTAPVTRDKCALSFDSSNHDDVIGYYYMEVEL